MNLRMMQGCRVKPGVLFFYGDKASKFQFIGKKFDLVVDEIQICVKMVKKVILSMALS
jgi:hypothetical protein